MQVKVQQTLNGLLDKWKELENRQQIRIIAIVIILILSLAITVYLFTKPVWMVLTDNRSQSEISQIQTALEDLNYKYKLGPNGTSILVENKNLTQAKVSLSTTDIMQSGGFTFKDAMDFSGMSSTEMVKKASFKYLAENELAKNILAFDGIKDAYVTLAIPDTNSYFIENSEKPSAGIRLTTTEPLASGAAESIARFVASGIVGLEIENIEITDQTMQTLYSGRKIANNSTSNEDEIVAVRKRELESKIQSSLKPLFDEVQIVSNLSFDWDKNKTVSRTYTPPIEDSEIGVVASSTTERQKGNSGTTPGEMGQGSNDQVTPEYQLGNGDVSYFDTKSEQNNYNYNEQESVTEKGVGTLVPADSNMLISVYKYKTHYQESIESSDILQGTSWEDYKDNLMSKKIDINTEYPELLGDISKGVGIENIALIGYEVPIFVDRIIKQSDGRYLPVFFILAALIALLAYGIIRSTKPLEIEDFEPELAIEELLVSTKIDHAKEEELVKLAELEVPKYSNARKQVEKFVSEKPEAVAQLLRNWISDDWE